MPGTATAKAISNTHVYQNAGGHGHIREKYLKIGITCVYHKWKTATQFLLQNRTAAMTLVLDHHHHHCRRQHLGGNYLD